MTYKEALTGREYKVIPSAAGEVKSSNVTWPSKSVEINHVEPRSETQATALSESTRSDETSSSDNQKRSFHHHRTQSFSCSNHRYVHHHNRGYYHHRPTRPWHQRGHNSFGSERRSVPPWIRQNYSRPHRSRYYHSSQHHRRPFNTRPSVSSNRFRSRDEICVGEASSGITSTKKELSTPDKDEVTSGQTITTTIKTHSKTPTPIVSIASIFKTKPCSKERRVPRVTKVQELVYFPVCSSKTESTVHFFPEMLSIPSFSFDMVYYQKLALVLKGKKGKIIRKAVHDWNGIFHQ